MSILIKGVDMPTTPKVYRCELTIYFDDGVGKFSHCHRVPPENVVFIKTPHGRLIDADKAIEEEVERCKAEIKNLPFRLEPTEQWKITTNRTELFKKAPTVIEAEE